MHYDDGNDVKGNDDYLTIWLTNRQTDPGNELDNLQ